MVQASSAEGLVDLALDDLSLDGFGLAGEFGVISNFLLGEGFFTGADGGWDILEGELVGLAGDDGHGKATVDFTAILGELDKSGDLATHVGVGSERFAFAKGEDFVAAEDEVLTHRNDGIGEDVLGRFFRFF